MDNEKCLNDAIDVTLRFCREKHPEHVCAFLGGSWARACAHEESDLDLVVVDPTVKGVRFEGLMYHSWLVDVCALAPKEIENLFQSSATYRSAPIMYQVMDAIVVSGDSKIATSIKERAMELLIAGPKPLTPVENHDLRWNLTALLTDLKFATAEEVPALAAQCYLKLADAALAISNVWRGERKSLRRAVCRAKPEIANKLDVALVAACQGDRAQILAIGSELLQELGGSERTYVEIYSQL